MAIQRDPSTGKFTKATAEPSSSIEQILAEEEQRKAALSADPSGGEAAAAAAAAAEEDAKKKAAAAAKPKDTESTDFLGDFVAPESRTPKPDKKADAEKAAAAAAKKADDAKKKREADEAAARRARPRTELTPEQIAAATAEGVARAMQAKPDAAKKPDAPAPDPNAGLPPDEQRKLNVLSHMEKLFPDRYKGLAEKYRTGQAKLDEYAAKWEKDHPGETFDESDDQHSEFMDAHNVDWLEEDYIEAIADIRAEAKQAALQKNSTEKVSALELKVNRREKLAEAVQAIETEKAFGRKEVWNGLGAGDVITENGMVNREKLTELNAKDPVGMPFRIAAAQDLDKEIEVIFKLMPPDDFKVNNRGLIDFNEKDPIHVAMSEFCDEAEKELSAKPVEDKTDADGRVFMPAAEYWALPKEKRENYWTLTAHDIAYLRARKIAKETDAQIKREKEKLKLFAKASGYTPPPDEENPGEEENREAPLPSQEKPHTPSLAGASRMAAAKNRPGAGTPASGKSFWSTF